MKKLKVNLILILLISIVCNISDVYAQYPTKVIEGVEYIIYTPEPAEGFYSIERKFKITKEELLVMNPELKNGVKSGQKILIPVKKENQPAAKENIIEYKVKKKQTVFSITKEFGITQEELEKLNPQIVNGLREGDILKIRQKNTNQPNNNNSIQTVNKKDESTNVYKNFITHTVQANETLFAISQQYQIHVEDIINMNPDVESILPIGTKLKIPLNSAYNSTPDELKKPIDIDIDNLFGKSNGVAPKFNTMRIAFLLPFMVSNSKSDHSHVRFTEFYAGALIAINQAKKNGISLEIFTYDTDKTEERIKYILNNNELKNMDLIIGPAYSSQISTVADFAFQNKVNTLIPFSSKVSEIKTNPFLFQFNPGNDVEIKLLKKEIIDTYKNANLVFLKNSNNIDEWGDNLQSELTKSRRQYLQITTDTLDTNLTLRNALRKNKQNILFFNSDRFQDAKSYISTILKLQNDYDILIYSQYNWLNQDFNNDKLLFVSPFKPATESPEIEMFKNEFATMFSWETSTSYPSFDILGFDLTTFFISLISQNGKKFSTASNTFEYSKGIQSDFKFERASKSSGFVNSKLYINGYSEE